MKEITEDGTETLGPLSARGAVVDKPIKQADDNDDTKTEQQHQIEEKATDEVEVVPEEPQVEE